MSRNSLKTGPYQRAVREWKKRQGEFPVCALCGLMIDTQAQHNSPGSFTVDHIIEVSQGIDPFDESNWQPAHRSCNSRKSDHVVMPSVATTSMPSSVAKSNTPTKAVDTQSYQYASAESKARPGTARSSMVRSCTLLRPDCVAAQHVGCTNLMN